MPERMSWIYRALIFLALAGAVTWFHHWRQSQPLRVTLAAEKKILLIGNGTEIETVDPHLATGAPEHRIISALFEGLVAPATDDPDKDGPGVAMNWETPDFATWTFHLNPKAAWSDGTPLGAQDFVYAYHRMLSPELAADYSEMLHIIKNAAKFSHGELKSFDEVGVKALDEHTLKIVLEGPAPYFPSMLKHYAWFPVPRHTIEKYGMMTERDTAWARPGNLVCNGVFTLKEWRINHYLAVEANPHYWDAERVRLKEIHFFPIEDYAAEERSFLDGQLHHTETVPLEKIAFYRETRPPFFHEDPQSVTEYYMCNVTREPLSDPRVRQALALTIDRATLINQVLKSGSRPAKGLVPPGSGAGYEGPDVLRFDPAEAKRLLAEAGYPDGKGMRELDVLTNTSPSARVVAEFFQESWRKHLGLKISIRQQEWGVYLDSRRKKTYDISRAGWVGDYPDPYTFLAIWRSFDGNNDTGWDSPRFDELMFQSEREPDARKRMELLLEGEKLLLGEMPCIPVYWRVQSHLMRSEVTGWKPSLLEHRCYKVIDLDPTRTMDMLEARR